jgi:hypothetical protein
VQDLAFAISPFTESGKLGYYTKELDGWRIGCKGSHDDIK